MKQLLTTLFLTITFNLLSQTQPPVKLNWKIASDEKLSYLTLMSEVGNSSVDFNWGGLFNLLSDSTGKGIKEAKNFFKELNQALDDYDHITTLTNKGNGVIDIVMNTRAKNDSAQVKNETKGMIKMMQDMNDGIVLRGSVYETGSIHSFWIQTNQKNLVSMLFELPSKPVQVGDSWPLEVSLIGNDQNFKCDTSYKRNKVTLVDIKKVNNETIAVLKYDLIEYVKGIFNTPAFFQSGKQIETMMKFEHQAIAEFSIDKGRWISYEGIMGFEASGVMTANKKTKFSLVIVK